MKRRSFALLLSLIIGIAYYGFCSQYFFGITAESADNGNVGAFLGSAIAGALTGPHIALGWIAVVLNVISFLSNSKGCALATVILYSISAILFIMYALFVLPEIILSIIGCVRMDRINRKNRERAEKKKAAKEATSA